MALAVTHSFVSAKTDGTDATLIKPSNWNASHVITMDTNTLMGKASAGTGPAEAIPTSAAMIALLASADLATFLATIGAPTTGDGKITLKTVADPGWVMCDDTSIGGPACTDANWHGAAFSALFTLLYNNVSDANAPLFTNTPATATTRAAQGSATTALAAGCAIALPKQLGRAIVGAGTGAGLTARALGSAFGADAITLALGQIPAGITSNGGIGGTTSNVASNPTITGGIAYVNGSLNAYVPGVVGAASVTGTAAVTSNNTGGSTTPVVQASAAWNVMIKL